MSLALAKRDRASMDGTILACPLREHSTSFQLVDEFGNGQPYAGLAYQLIDHEDIIYTGTLDATGSGKVENHYCGPVELRLSQAYNGHEENYKELMRRKHYPLPITELQVRAEITRFFNKSGMHTTPRVQGYFTKWKCVSWWNTEHTSRLWPHVISLPTGSVTRWPRLMKSGR